MNAGLEDSQQNAQMLPLKHQSLVGYKSQSVGLLIILCDVFILFAGGSSKKLQHFNRMLKRNLTTQSKSLQQRQKYLFYFF